MNPRIILAVVFSLATVNSIAQLDTAFVYQGQIVANGEVLEGLHDLSFVILDGATTGDNPVGTPQVINDVEVVGGVFTVELDFGPIFNSGPLWIQTYIWDSALMDLVEVGTPRPLLALPVAQHVEDLEITPWQVGSSSHIYYNDGPVAIGSDTANARLEVHGDGVDDPLRIRAQSTTALQLHDDSGVSVGTASGPPAQGLLVQGVTEVGGESDDGAQLYISRNTQEHGLLVDCQQTACAALNILSQTAHEDGIAILAHASAAAGSAVGVEGGTMSSAANARGVSGIALASTGPNFGVYGRATSADGYGVRAYNRSSDSSVAARLEGNVQVDALAGGDPLDVKVGTASKLKVSANGGLSAGGTSVSPQSNGAYFESGLAVGTDSDDATIVIRPTSGSALRVRAAGSTKLRMFDNGGTTIGGNTVPPQDGLYVTGEIATSAITRQRVVGAHSGHRMNLVDPMTISLSGLNCVDQPTVGGDNKCEVIFNLDLPHGASIVGLSARVDDSNADAAIKIYLEQTGRVLGTGFYTLITSLQTTQSGTPGSNHLLSQSIAGHAVDNENFAYRLTVEFDGGDTSGVLYRSATVDYTLNRLSGNW
ncbi:MAG: hypothetical protein DHS20C11_18500 [Lysobacteraceae bacterium]|nr:MAG: hypothetical protein DHS20C11_18500 [Xanthomonadaceae bacterium]